MECSGVVWWSGRGGGGRLGEGRIMGIWGDTVGTEAAKIDAKREAQAEPRKLRRERRGRKMLM